MAALKTQPANTKTGKQELTPTEKRTLVSARDVMATLLDVRNQARKCGMQTAAITETGHSGKKVVIIAIAIPEHDVMAEGGTFTIDGRAITNPAAWTDLRDVMAEDK